MRQMFRLLALTLGVALVPALARAAGYGALPSGVAAWWDDRTAGLIGSAFGIYGGVFGTVVGVLGSSGRARCVVIGFMMFTGVAGIFAAAAGLIALALRQPYGVWYPLLLGGLLFAVLSFSLLPTLKRRFAEEEMRRIDSQGIGGAYRT